jgi:hypothetical protein
MNSKKNGMGLFSVVMGMAVLSGCGAAAPQAEDSLQAQPSRAEVKVAEARPSHLPDFKLEQMSVLLDGKVQTLGSLQGARGGPLSVIVDEESLRTGVARAYRTPEEFDAYVANQNTRCATSDVSAMDTTSQCVFYDTLSCTGWSLRLAINCGYAVGGLAGLMTVQSFGLGCGTTFVCPTADCSGTCLAATGPAGACVDITSGLVQCAGCVN